MVAKEKTPDTAEHAQETPEVQTAENTPAHVPSYNQETGAFE